MDKNVIKKNIYSFPLSTFLTFFFSLFLYHFLSSLSFFLRHSLLLCQLSSFFYSSLFSNLQNLHLSLLFFFFFSLLFLFFVTPLLYVFFFFSLSHSLFLLFSLPRPLPLRSAVAVEFGLTDEVNWWRSHLSLGFFFFPPGCGFHVIVGGGGVGLIPCDLGCINGVDSSLHLEFCVDFGDFFFY